MTRGERAAARFVHEVTPERVLAAIGEDRHPGYRRVAMACRADLRLPMGETARPAERLIQAFPRAERVVLTQLLTKLLDAAYDQRRVSERAAFLVGVAVGRLFRPTQLIKAGAR